MKVKRMSSQSSQVPDEPPSNTSTETQGLAFSGRSAGVLLPVFSLPGKYGIGSLGDRAREFIDWLSLSGMQVWQVLPLTPTGYGDSPYSSLSAFAGNELLIDLDHLVSRGWLSSKELNSLDFQDLRNDSVDYEAVRGFKSNALAFAFEGFEKRVSEADSERFESFCERNASWLVDYAVFRAVKQSQEQKSWLDWPEELRIYSPDLVSELLVKHSRHIKFEKFQQWLFAEQWAQLREYASSKGVKIFGDIPIFVALDSADVWSNQGLFELDPTGQPTAVAGVPPDYFSENGQLWGNPLYRWSDKKADVFAWWQRRIERSLVQFDVIRLDHFRGFQAFWKIKTPAETAKIGMWEPGPGVELFEYIATRLGREVVDLPFVAEDLGLITEAVHALRNELQFPGMAVLQFAFGGEADQPFLPHNLESKTILYLGTHDNDTTCGWLDSLKVDSKQDSTLEPDVQSLEDDFKCEVRESAAGAVSCNESSDSHVGLDQPHEATEPAVSSNPRQHVCRYLGLNTGSESRLIVEELIRAALASVAQVVILSVQDLRSLPSSCRLNTPSEGEGNWQWRMPSDYLGVAESRRIAEWSRLYGRS